MVTAPSYAATDVGSGGKGRQGWGVGKSHVGMRVRHKETIIKYYYYSGLGSIGSLAFVYNYYLIANHK